MNRAETPADREAGAGWRTILLPALAVAMVSCAPPVKTPQDVVAYVRGTDAWMAGLERCPVDVMPADMRMNALQERSCEGDGMRACLWQCQNDDVDSCFWLAYAIQQSKLDVGASEALFQRACTLGEPSGCTNRAAGMLHLQVEDASTRQCAARTFERTCELRDAWGCTMFGGALHAGKGVARDDARALEVLSRVCEPDVPDDEPACSGARGLIRKIESAR